MAFFNTKKNKKTDDTSAKKSVKAEKTSVKVVEKKGTKAAHAILDHVIIRPRITEKASHIAEKNAYTFDVAPKANKRNIAKEVERIYKVTPIKVHVVKIQGKVVFSRGKVGKRSGGKKAYVTLKEGDKIEFV